MKYDIKMDTRTYTLKLTVNETQTSHREILSLAKLRRANNLYGGLELVMSPSTLDISIH